MVEKSFVLLVAVCFTIFSMSFISALDINLVSPDYANRTVEITMNFTINNTDGESWGNITELFITLPTGAIFTVNTNIADNARSNFTNTTNAAEQQVLIWTNITEGFIENTTINGANSTAGQFEFNVTFNIGGANTFTINTSYEITGVGNQTTYNEYVYFAFSGYVKNETGDLQPNTNVSLYRFDEGVGGPPTETLLEIGTTDSNGLFHFASINSSADNYKLEFIYYFDGTNPTVGNATKVGSILPPFPSSLFYPPYGAETFDMGLNGSTFYLQEATTLNIIATNSTGDAINFGYEVTDQLLGFPISSNVMGNVTNQLVVVPTGRDYTVMAVREPSQFSLLTNDCWTEENLTIGTEAIAGTCPTPPKSNSTLSGLPAGAVVNVSINLSVSKIYVYGCIHIAEGHNETNVILNVTNIIPRLLPWSGFVITSMKADDGSLNISLDDGGNPQLNNINLTDDAICNKSSPNTDNIVAFYNFSLLGSSEYLIEVYAKNASNEDTNPADAWDLAGFQNISTSTTDMYQNITLYRLFGNYSQTSDKNTSVIQVIILNSTGDTLTTNPGHITVKVKHPVFETITYVIESTTNGEFTIPILNNSNWAKVYVFPNEAPPMERTLNLSNFTNFITLRAIDFVSGGDKGLRYINSTGEIDTLNTSADPLELEFFSTRTGCDVVNPAASCLITTMNATDFNPLKALVAGKVNMRLKFTSTGASLMFHNFDLFSAKQPPMFSIINQNATTAASNSQIWDFGSFAPVDAYKNVTIAMPYSDDTALTSFVNDSRTIYISLPALYTEDEGTPGLWQTAWNRSNGDTAVNLTDDLIEYNQSAFVSYLTTDGISCSISDTTAVCYADITANIIYATIPHFSGASPSVSGSNPAAPTTTATSVGGSAAAVTVWTKTITATESQLKEGLIKEIGKNERVRFKILGDWHQVGVTTVTTSSATIEVSSEPQTATLAVGEEKKFDVTGDDNYYDISVKLNSITNNKASLTIKSISEKMPEEKVPTEEEEKAAEKEEELQAAGKTYIWIIAVVVIIILAVIVWIIIKKRK